MTLDQIKNETYPDDAVIGINANVLKKILLSKDSTEQDNKILKANLSLSLEALNDIRVAYYTNGKLSKCII